jgi:hypothetical protein
LVRARISRCKKKEKLAHPTRFERVTLCLRRATVTRPVAEKNFLESVLTLFGEPKFGGADFLSDRLWRKADIHKTAKSAKCPTADIPILALRIALG